MSKKKNIDGLLRRLEDIKGILDERIVNLSGKSIRRVYSRVGHSNKQRSTLVKPTTRLSDLLLSSSGQSYFMEFMDRRGRMRPLQFWLLVNNIKDPLEDADSDPLPQHSSWTQNDIDDLSAILNGYFSDSALDVDEQLKQDLASFLANPDVATVEQYQKARKSILVTQQTVYTTMEREDWPLFRKTDLWHKYIAAADSAPTTPAKPTPQPKQIKLAPVSMARSHSTGTLPSRPLGIVTPRNESATDLRKLLTKSPSRVASGESHASSDDALSRGEESSATVPQQSEEEVVNAISAALNDIIKSDAKDDLVSVYSRNSSDLGERPMPSSGRSSIDLSRSTELSPTTEERRTASSERTPTPTEPQRERVPIFDDDDDYRPDFAIDMLTRTNSAENTKTNGLGIHVDVIEELEMVEVDIERLKREIRLTTSMIGKAELTGSYEELRLLKDSRASMERELARKEQLRETYANQDGEHNLTVLFPLKRVVNSRNGLRLNRQGWDTSLVPISWCTISLFDSSSRMIHW
jgi:sorting nexin-25